MTPEFQRIFWKLQGPLEACVFVVQDWHNKDLPREPYAQHGISGNTIWHIDAQAPLTEPKIESITVRVSALENWQGDWVEWHRHAELDDENCVFGELDPELYRYTEDENADDNEDDEEDDEAEPDLLRCCDTDRPTRAPRLVVKPSDTSKGYVTVHDYISAVHPWLMGLREDIIQADNIWEDRKPESYKQLVVNYNGLSTLMILDEERHLRDMGTPLEPAPVSDFAKWFTEMLQQEKLQPAGYKPFYIGNPEDLPEELRAPRGPP